MMHVVNFSGGVCSFWAAKRVVQQHGTKDVTLLFADTLIEDEDLYVFNQQCSDHLGVPITRIVQGETPWEVFRREGIIGNSRFPVCSFRLKREPLDAWHEQNCGPASTIIYVGMDWEESDRLGRMRKALPKWNIQAPMIDEPIWQKGKMLCETEKLGIKIPRLYSMGFPHNNCGGACVAAGISHFVHLYHMLPRVYLEWETQEQVAMMELAQRGIKPLTMLKDRRGGVKKSLSLLQLRTRIESGEKLDKFDWGACGCSVNYA